MAPIKRLSKTTQGDLFLPPIFDLRDLVLKWTKDPPLFVIGCGQRKNGTTTTADKLYSSDRFRATVRLVRLLDAQFLIVSGKHGLLEPGKKISPYDFHVSKLDTLAKTKWAKNIAAKLEKQSSNICILAHDAYTAPILDAFQDLNSDISVSWPFKDVEEHYFEGWLEQAEKQIVRHCDLDRLYQIIANIRKAGETFELGDLGKRQLPNRGVYVFLDPNETSFRRKEPRIVRIGTHAVSEGSKSTLKTRLRNHLGQESGGGNHRGSIFRLHVGRAMLEASGGHSALSSWGDGQDAPPEVRLLEQDHEQAVSAYLRKLEVFIIPADDKPSKDSLRAHLERQLIALYSENFQTIDLLGKKWLGRFSPVESIVKSGLWNIRDVGAEYDPKGVGSVDNIECMLGE